MRVVAGISKGIPLKAPKGDVVRPTVDRLKETLFNIIQYEINGQVVLDVFAGSGALGIEALSRGAKQAYFCEKNKNALAIIEENLHKTKLKDKAKVYSGDFLIGLQQMKIQQVQVDLVFLDPPYHKDNLYDMAISALLDKELLTEGALIIAEATGGFDFSFLSKYDTIQIEKIKKFKTNQYLFIRYGNGE